MNNVFKTYIKSVKAIEDVSLEVPKVIYGLLRPNGKVNHH